MYREQFVRENPEIASQQDKAGNKGIQRILAIVILGVSSIMGTIKYCNEEDFRKKVNDIPSELFDEVRKLIR